MKNQKPKKRFSVYINHLFKGKNKRDTDQFEIKKPDKAESIYSLHYSLFLFFTFLSIESISFTNGFPIVELGSL